MLANFEKLKKPRKFYSDERRLKNKLFEVLNRLVRELVKGHEEIPIAFSGGLDSSVIAFLVSRYAEPVLFCVGFRDSYDAGNSKKIVELLDLKLNIIYLDDFNLKKYLDQTVEMIGTNNKLAVELNLPFFILVEELKGRGYKNFISGQGADELFGGYYKYKKSKNLENDLFDDIKNIYKTNLQYNFKICNHFKINPLYPFLEKEVVEFAVKISPDLKIKNGVQKYILRKAFMNYLPKEIIKQRKKSFQYGSGAHKALRKLK